MLSYLLFLLIGFTAGIISGLIGIGGGIIVVPAFMFLLGMTQHQAQGTSLAMLLPPIGLFAVLSYWQKGYINWWVAGFAAIGFFIGGYFGASFANSISDALLKKVFGVSLLLIGFYIILK